MKLATKLAAATLLALSAAVPALATEPEALTLAERNTYLYTADARPLTQHSQYEFTGGSEAFALAASPNEGITDHGNFDDY